MDGTQFVNGAVLLSGGIDSTALTYLLRPKYAITIDYGQVAAPAEIDAAGAVCTELHIHHEIVRVDCAALGAGTMAGDEPIAGSTLRAIAPTPEWWPYRNQLVVTFAAARALALGLTELAVGTVKTDGDDHRDGLPAFFDLMNQLLRLQEGGLGIQASAIGMHSVELVRISKVPMSVLAWSHSCHHSAFACGWCRGCLKHQRVMDDVKHSLPANEDEKPT
jgi:7-cyano-7-deazaguanine synthase